MVSPGQTGLMLFATMLTVGIGLTVTIVAAEVAEQLLALVIVTV